MKRKRGGWDRKNERIKEENGHERGRGRVYGSWDNNRNGWTAIGHWTGGRLGVEQEEGTEEIEVK
jgi:hypothetical protein